ncbi:lysostaphin resistance A-like protein [Streptomyces bobili]|uniref:CPBP family intramembrane glutamic endopeptidase n=1 Tax=Streptomyces bobili TaxID=67280 RepID=UPI00339E54BE
MPAIGRHFGAVAGWLTVRTGGLEAAIGLHAVNNLLAFAAVASVVDGLRSDDTAADAPWELVRSTWPESPSAPPPSCGWPAVNDPPARPRPRLRPSRPDTPTPRCPASPSPTAPDRTYQVCPRGHLPLPLRPMTPPAPRASVRP